MIQAKCNGAKCPLFPNLGRHFFSKIWFRQSLDIIISDYHVQYQKKTNDPILRKLSKRKEG